MTKVEAIIQTAKLEAVKTALHEIGVEGMTVLEVRGHGRQKGHTEVYRGREYTVDLIPKIKIEMVLGDDMVESVTQAIITSAQTGKIGDGKIFLSRVDDAIRIRNDERGDNALLERMLIIRAPEPMCSGPCEQPVEGNTRQRRINKFDDPAVHGTGCQSFVVPDPHR